jgi:transposase
MVSRDRASVYSRGAGEGAQEAIQVADRFHLVQNAGEMLERVLYRQHRSLRQAVQDPKEIPPISQSVAEVGTQGPPKRDPKPCSAAQAQSEHRRDRRKQRYERLKELQAQGLSLRAMAEKASLSCIRSRNGYERSLSCKSRSDREVRVCWPDIPTLFKPTPASINNFVKKCPHCGLRKWQNG